MRTLASLTLSTCKNRVLKGMKYVHNKVGNYTPNAFKIILMPCMHMIEMI